ncbi:MAG: hypothetical protein ACQGVK_04505 [Myxococcota bacterium]
MSPVFAHPLIPLLALAVALGLAGVSAATAAEDAELRPSDRREVMASDARVAGRREPDVAARPPSSPPGPARGALLPAPPRFGTFPAGTYAADGDRLGSAELSLVEREGGLIEVSVGTGVEGGARNDASAVLQRMAGNRVRVVRERSEAHDDAGQSMGVMHIDHERGLGICTPPGKTEADAEILELPEDEQVVNVPLNLLFLPLVRGEVETVDFQYFLCRGGARLMDFRARLAGRQRDADGRHFIEVAYGPELGTMVSWIAKQLIPRLSFWFEANEDGTYLAHRMPLFSKGPEVVVVRDDFSSRALLPLD